MIIDHPYIQSAKIVTSYDDKTAQAVNTLVVETTIELVKAHYNSHEEETSELLELLAQLKSFADNDFGDFQAVEIHSPQKHYFARNLGHTNRIAMPQNV
jgi:hypothetical protein